MRPTDIFVMDNGSNIKVAFLKQTLIGCAHYYTNPVPFHSSEQNHKGDCAAELGMPDEVNQLNNACKV